MWSSGGAQCDQVVLNANAFCEQVELKSEALRPAYLLSIDHRSVRPAYAYVRPASVNEAHFRQ